MNKTRTHVSLSLLSATILMALPACVLPVPGAAIGTGARPVAQRATATPNENLNYCSSTIDCGSGEFCKDRGDGMKLCMGDGYNGDYCSSSIDCDSGMFCKGRGDGLKVCMGDGGKGAFCSSSIDCDSGMFCKGRGDGINVCM